MVEEYKRGRSKPITIDGVYYKSRVAACEAYGITYNSVLNRVRKTGMSWEEAISKGESLFSVTVFGDRYRSTTEFCHITGLCIPTARKYIKNVTSDEDISAILELYYNFVVNGEMKHKEFKSKVDKIRSKYNLPTLWPTY